MTDLIFESHATSCDNEKGIASGNFESPLSQKGINQAKELGTRYQKSRIDLICCSDLSRSFKTAELAFPERISSIIKEKRLREWNYGTFNGHASSEVEQMKQHHIQEPFPKGESLQMAILRIYDFLDEIIRQYHGKTLLFIGHRALFYALEHRYHQRNLHALTIELWKWQPGWHYVIPG